MKPLQILLAEDNQGDIYLVKEALATHHVDCEMHVVNDGEQALNFVEHLGEKDNPKPDLLMLDLNLPKAEGDVVLRKFRSLPDCGQTPVIIVTSSDAPKDRERVSQLGISCYFRKPSDLADFMRLGSIVKSILSGVPATSCPSGV